jgi:hypothetical protein
MTMTALTKTNQCKPFTGQRLFQVALLPGRVPVSHHATVLLMLRFHDISIHAIHLCGHRHMLDRSSPAVFRWLS